MTDQQVAPTTQPAPPTRPADDPTKAASVSMVVSGVRCLLAYVVFPWVLPAASRTGGVGPAIGLVVGLVAIGFNVASIRRFQRSNHRWRWHITALNSAVIILLTVLVVRDVADLLG
ncbi:MAG TPA: hypothetical protein VM262_09045 [Acidimicrobiales bacterium]|nr:hypothetical protein [Acidimicrobiales bacterium]